jgi:hypothetical protein
LNDQGQRVRMPRTSPAGRFIGPIFLHLSQKGY